MKVCVVVNQNARRNKARPELPEKLARIFGSEATVRVTPSIESIQEIAREAKTAETETLAICGGDGTLHHTLTAFHHVYGKQPMPRILTLSGGTMNMICRSVKVQGPSEGIANRFRAAMERGKAATVERATVSAGGKLCFIFGLGLVTNFLDAYYEGGNTSPLKAAVIVQKTIRSALKQGEFAKRLFAPWDGEIVINGETLPATYFTAVLAQTIENLAFSFNPMYRALERNDRFHVIATQMGPVKLVNHLPKIWVGKPVNHPELFDRLAEEMVLKPSGRLLYTMDGDLYSTESSLKVTVGPTLTFWQV